MKKIFYGLFAAVLVLFSLGGSAKALTLDELFNSNSDGMGALFSQNTVTSNPGAINVQTGNTNVSGNINGTPYSFTSSGDTSYNVTNTTSGSTFSNTTQISQITTSQSDNGSSVISTTSNSSAAPFSGSLFGGSLISQLSNLIFSK